MGDHKIGRHLAGLLVVGVGLFVFAVDAGNVGAATLWWQTAPGPTPALSAVSSNSSFETLAISSGVAGWLDPKSGRFRSLSTTADVAYVAASGDSGLIMESDGALYQSSAAGAIRLLQRLPGRPLGLAIAAGVNPVALAVTSSGVYRGALGTKLRPLTPDPIGLPVAMAGPVTSSERFAVASSRGIFLLGKEGRPRLAPHSPRLGAHAHLAELGDGVILAGDGKGLISAVSPGRSTPVFQLLPYGGLGGVPQLTGIVGVGADAAYLATSGFGTLLTPDGGYSWYRASPPVTTGTILALATVGPIYGPRPSGLVLAVSSSGLFLHRLQSLPTPPSYSAGSEASQLGGTTLVTALAAALVIWLMWIIRRRERRRLFV